MVHSIPRNVGVSRLRGGIYTFRVGEKGSTFHILLFTNIFLSTKDVGIGFPTNNSYGNSISGRILLMVRANVSTFSSHQKGITIKDIPFLLHKLCLNWSRRFTVSNFPYLETITSLLQREKIHWHRNVVLSSVVFQCQR